MCFLFQIDPSLQSVLEVVQCIVSMVNAMTNQKEVYIPDFLFQTALLLQGMFWVFDRLRVAYMVKTFKNLLQNRGCLGTESLHKSSGTRGVPKLLK